MHCAREHDPQPGSGHRLEHTMTTTILATIEDPTAQKERLAIGGFRAGYTPTFAASSATATRPASASSKHAEPTSSCSVEPSKPAASCPRATPLLAGDPVLCVIDDPERCAQRGVVAGDDVGEHIRAKGPGRLGGGPRRSTVSRRTAHRGAARPSRCVVGALRCP